MEMGPPSCHRFHSSSEQATPCARTLGFALLDGGGEEEAKSVAIKDEHLTDQLPG